ncbi:MAG: porphobilinogen synthase, partial [Candidatus Omnitrophica bacterium]|nr:porphobilinogen synthase [Candidatus Omnitrophota bacterium]
AYTSHGHCGVVKEGAGEIDNQATLKALSEMALLHAQVGADYVAPSAMANTQVQAIRRTLDSQGYQYTKIIGYSAKFASNFYGPFREVADSAPRFGGRQGYQLNYNDSKTALFKVEQDIREGADIVMVKPALGYLDIVKKVKSEFNYPLAVYNVSGEYAMVKAGARAGFWNEEAMVFEVISSIKRAGADFIITYHAKDIAKWRR